ncbi:conserved hypothetical protein [Lausannevirus]|uniref:Uncharacterized protein n=2 Tax=Lausannevirus TaxID=999883 RepID=A0A0N9PV85_9VIRU|nr:hypothetical protein LAU_0013 [Lausannevirus]AEA06869.1 conserved hypothetical protein [Lausannevirus]ALH06710.1 hypothetical protein PMV_012 [Port-miou virus]
MSLVYSVSFSAVGSVESNKDKRLAILEKKGDTVTFSFLPVSLSSGKVKYPICLGCGTPVIWSKGKCRCGNLVEKESTKYKIKNTKQRFQHTTWQI